MCGITFTSRFSFRQSSVYKMILNETILKMFKDRLAVPENFFLCINTV